MSRLVDRLSTLVEGSLFHFTGLVSKNKLGRSAYGKEFLEEDVSDGIVIIGFTNYNGYIGLYDACFLAGNKG